MGGCCSSKEPDLDQTLQYAYGQDEYGLYGEGTPEYQQKFEEEGRLHEHDYDADFVNWNQEAQLICGDAEHNHTEGCYEYVSEHEPFVEKHLIYTNKASPQTSELVAEGEMARESAEKQGKQKQGEAHHHYSEGKQKGPMISDSTIPHEEHAFQDYPTGLAGDRGVDETNSPMENQKAILDEVHQAVGNFDEMLARKKRASKTDEPHKLHTGQVYESTAVGGNDLMGAWQHHSLGDPSWKMHHAQEIKKRKPAMEISIVIPQRNNEEDIFRAGGSDEVVDQDADKARIEHVLTVPAKKYRGPPPLTPYPEPPKAVVITQMAQPKGGWQSADGSNQGRDTSSTSTKGFFKYIPMIGGKDKEESSSKSNRKKHKKDSKKSKKK